jgi:hypothetical protein
MLTTGCVHRGSHRAFFHCLYGFGRRSLRDGSDALAGQGLTADECPGRNSGVDRGRQGIRSSAQHQPPRFVQSATCWALGDPNRKVISIP